MHLVRLSRLGRLQSLEETFLRDLGPPKSCHSSVTLPDGHFLSERHLSSSNIPAPTPFNTWVQEVCFPDLPLVNL